MGNKNKGLAVIIVAILMMTGCHLPWGENRDDFGETMNAGTDNAITGNEPTGDITEMESRQIESSEAETSSTEAVIGTLAEATGYPWSDVYIVIMNTVLTKPDEHTGIPSFALLPWNDREEPVLIIGYWQDPVAQDYTIYSFYGDTLIEVEHMTGEIMICSKDRQILCQKSDGTQEAYQYEEDHLVKLETGAYSMDEFEPVSFTSLNDHTITVENIKDYIQVQ